ncbi:MAG: flagellar biosynthetic protein FliR, partial [Syntrophomonadaceae bacterium]|nr:flagellar biosynthetic protein FliR [Syntrophomonadaceae bacterium]
MDVLGVFFNRIDAFLLILSRVSGVLGIAPVFASQRVPVTVRAGLAALLAFIIALSRTEPVPPMESLPALAGGIAGEFLLGFAMGYIVYLVMAAAQTAGQVIDMQMGFGIVNVLDPQSGAQLPLVGNLQYLLALLVLLGMDGHHLMISGIVRSYDLVPVLGFTIDSGATDLLV